METGLTMKIFITGATGVIGRRLIPILSNAGHEVTAGLRSRASASRLEGQPAIVEVDLFDQRALERTIGGHDAVVNLATRIPPPSRIFLPWAWRENDRLRRVASAAIVDACLATGVPRVIQESFAPVYPDRGDQWIDETTPIEPVRYNRSVADAEASANRFSQQGGTGIVVRFGAFYGPDAFQTIELIKCGEEGVGTAAGSGDRVLLVDLS